MTEPMQKFEYVHENEKKVARWSDIRKLFELETNDTVKLCKLDEIYVTPKPIERQRVSTCLKTFCDETIVAIKVHAKIDNAEGTISFLELVTKFWKILNNVRTKNLDIRKRDADKLAQMRMKV